MSGWTFAELTDAIEQAHRAGYAGHAKLLEAVRADQIRVFIASRNAPFPMALIKRSAMPTLVLIGDDDYASSGPAGWPFTRRLMNWARAAMVHGAGAGVEPYATAVSSTIAYRRFVMIETSSTQVHAWAAAAAGMPMLVILPSLGAHPTLPSSGDVH